MEAWTPLNYIDQNGVPIAMVIPVDEELFGVAFVGRVPALERRCAVIAELTLAATRQRYDPTFVSRFDEDGDPED